MTESRLATQLPAADLSSRLRSVSESSTMVRGNRGFGRKPSKSLLAKLAEVGPVSIHHYDQTTGETTIQTLHDPNPVVDANKRDYLSGRDGYTSKERDFKRVANIPLGFIEQLYQQGINVFSNEDWPKIAAILDDPEFLFLRTAPGRISRRIPREYPQAKEGWLKR